MNGKYQVGEAIYFHHLYDDKACEIRSGPDEFGEYTFRVEGKPRRMVILGKKPRIFVETATPKNSGQNDLVCYEAKGLLRYLVVSVQSRPVATPRCLPLPDLLDEGKVSYVVLKPILYPVESIAQKVGQKPTQIEKTALDQILKELSAQGLGYPTKWDRD